MAVSKALISRLRQDYALDWHGIHGSPHWARVRNNGLKLVEVTGADLLVVELFAFIHDSCRHNELEDADHGLRAAEYAEKLRNDSFLDVTDMQFSQLQLACANHTHELSHSDITIATCWDSDRIDLPRVGIVPDPNRMATAAGASIARSMLYPVRSS